MRARLFAKWFNDYAKKDNYIIKAAIIKDESVDNYIGIIIPRDNPNLEVYLSQFNEFVQFFTEKPMM